MVRNSLNKYLFNAVYMLELYKSLADVTQDKK